MAGNKINTKAKGKDDRSKGSKTMNSTNEESEDHDFSLLRKPVQTSVTGFAQARKIFDYATEELKGLLANECDLLYECKVCRNIFRSLANFISHKRVYCKEKFSKSVHSHFVKNNTTANELLKIKQMEEAYQESLKVTNLVANEHDDRIPLTKDLTGIMEKLTKIKGRYSFDEQLVTLQKIPNSSVAVFQSHCEEKKFDNMLTQVQELDNIISRNNAVLQSDGTFAVQSSVNADKAEDNVIQISDDEDSDEGRVPKCKICDMQFSTQKTLKFHMKYKHLESRLVFPCPDCFEIFSTSWSVYRHLFKVHRKSAAQIRRLRESIQAKAFRMNNPPAFYEKKKNKPITPQKISEEERLDQENQAWMDNMEGDGELPRCGGCGRTFERRAALAAHTHTCQPRSRALQRRPDKRIEIQIRKDYHKGPTGNPLPRDENKQVHEGSQNTTKASGKKVDPLEKNLIPSENNVECDEENPEPVPEIKDAKRIEINPAQKQPESNQNVLEEATMDIIDDRSSDSVDSPEKAPVTPLIEKKAKARLPYSNQAENSNLAAFKLRMRGDVDMDKLLCKKCDTKHDGAEQLYEHMSDHYKWMRYACKLCNFKNYDFEKLPEHVKLVHKLKGDSDFYFSTVKAIDGTQALELTGPGEESEANEDSAESRRPSRCSSDSSRLSDDSSSSSTRVEGSRKRKMYHNRSGGKRKKEPIDETDSIKEGDSTDRTNNIENSQSPSNMKSFEENSSDMDDIEEKLSKQTIKELIMPSVASRRPVRKKTKPKNEDFEYDLSNLLKMEAQGYRDSQTVTTTKTTQTKKKLIQEIQTNYDNVNKEHIGALALLSKKAVDKAAAELKTTNFGPPSFNVQKEQRLPNIFARPMVPKVSRGDKISPRKDASEDAMKDGPNSNKLQKIQDAVRELKINKANAEENTHNPGKQDNVAHSISASNDKTVTENEQTLNSESKESTITKLKIPAVVPIKFRQQGLEVMKNPIINKNISDFTKAGMKTKILLIKPINRNKDGVPVNTPLKFQTIKLKEQNKGTTSSEESSNDQVVVVKVPKVERTIPRHVPDSQRIVPAPRTESVSNDLDTKMIAPEASCPINSSDTNKPDTGSEINSGCNMDQTDTNNSINMDNSGSDTTKTLDHPEIIENSENIDKDGCDNYVSNNISEPMDTQELNRITQDGVVESDNIQEITEISNSSVQEPSTDSIGLSELCTLSNDAINAQESVNMDSAVITNHTPS